MIKTNVLKLFFSKTATNCKELLEEPRDSTTLIRSWVNFWPLHHHQPTNQVTRWLTRQLKGFCWKKELTVLITTTQTRPITFANTQERQKIKILQKKTKNRWAEARLPLESSSYEWGRQFKLKVEANLAFRDKNPSHPEKVQQTRPVLTLCPGMIQVEMCLLQTLHGKWVKIKAN